MFAALISLLLQESHQPAGEEGASSGAEHAGAEHAGAAADSSGGHEPAWLTEQVTHIFGPAVVKVEGVIMPPIYNLFGAHWTPPAPDHAIPDHVVFAIVLFLICAAVVLLLRG